MQRGPGGIILFGVSLLLPLLLAPLLSVGLAACDCSECSPPPPSCNGAVLTTYHHVGDRCGCDFEPTQTDCAAQGLMCQEFVSVCVGADAGLDAHD